MGSCTVVTGIAMVVMGCGDRAGLRYSGTIHVTEATDVAAGIASASVFGRITVPGALTPTSSTGICEYYEVPPDGGIAMGDLIIAGLADTVLISPTPDGNGDIYEQVVQAEVIAENSDIGASLNMAGDDGTVSVSVDAAAPRPFAAVSLPATVSLSAPPTIRWDAGNADEVWIGLGLGVEQGLRCRTSDDFGSFTWPRDALALFAVEGPAVVSLTRRNLGQLWDQQADLYLELAVESQAFRAVALTP
jgi:hypothetical protein